MKQQNNNIAEKKKNPFFIIAVLLVSILILPAIAPQTLKADLIVGGNDPVPGCPQIAAAQAAHDAWVEAKAEYDADMAEYIRQNTTYWYAYAAIMSQYTTWYQNEMALWYMSGRQGPAPVYDPPYLPGRPVAPDPVGPEPALHVCDPIICAMLMSEPPESEPPTDDETEIPDQSDVPEWPPSEWPDYPPSPSPF
jgi:hypothetical protein